jgi:hypothetical protein
LVHQDDDIFCIGEEEATNWSMEVRAYKQESMAALQVAKEVLRTNGQKESVRELNRIGRLSHLLANSAIDWLCLLLRAMSGAAEEDFFLVNFVIFGWFCGK